MICSRPTTGVAAVSMALLAAACGSSGHPASGAASARSPTPASSLAPSPTASGIPATPAPVGSASPTATATTATCAAMAAHAFLHVTAVKAGTNGALTLTGNPATVVCGGPDDLHYDIATTTVTAHVIPRASIMVFPIPAMHLETIGPYRLASYLASDQDTRIFLVTGPLSRITGLQEEYHP